MDNEYGRGAGDPRPGDEWASGAGAGPGGYGHRPAPGYGDGPAAGGNAGGPAPGGYGHVQPGSGRSGAWHPTTAFPAQQGGADPYAPQPADPGAGQVPPGQVPPGQVPPGQAGPEQVGPGGRPPGGQKSGRGVLVAVVIVAMLLSGGLGGWVGASVAGGNGGTGLSAPISTDQPDERAPDGTFEAVADEVLPSVVSIEVLSRSGRGEGSGVILSADGHIVTNNHVVAGAAEGGRIEVRFDDGTWAPADIIGQDPATDIAVIRAETDHEMSPIALGTSANLDEGQSVAAVGSPLGLSGTITTGIVSALNRPVRAGGAQSDQSTVIDAIQTDAAVNPGNSGGALVNMNGELVGINSAIASMGGGRSAGSIGLGFAIPVDQARRVADQIIKQGYATRAVLGVTVSDAPRMRGALVRGTAQGGPAEEAGIEQGAVIVSVDDRIVDDSDAVVAAIRSHNPGETVTVTYAAGEGEETTSVDVVLGEAR